jgi:hypothetical protein
MAFMGIFPVRAGLLSGDIRRFWHICRTNGGEGNHRKITTFRCRDDIMIIEPALIGKEARGKGRPVRR